MLRTPDVMVRFHPEGSDFDAINFKLSTAVKKEWQIFQNFGMLNSVYLRKNELMNLILEREILPLREDETGAIRVVIQWFCWRL